MVSIRQNVRSAPSIIWSVNSLPAELVTRASDLVRTSYTDMTGAVCAAPQATVDAAIRALGPDRELPFPIVCEPGQPCEALTGHLTASDGTQWHVDNGIAPPAGYYDLWTGEGQRRLVISAPPLLPQPARGWGWAVQLYAARSRRSWGIGDFRDLAMIARSAQEAGAESVLVSPVHAAAPVSAQQASPYSPSSRQWLQLLHIAIDDVPGAAGADLADLARSGLALNQERLIDRDTVWTLKRTALERIWTVVRGNLPVEHDLWVAGHGQDLTRFATWCVLAELYDTSNWRIWAEPHRHPDKVGDFAELHADRVKFFAWSQWVADLQFAAACQAGATVVADIAVGFDASSADAWAYQDEVSFDFEVGCPPDGHNLDGQKWGLAPLSPAALVSSDFVPFIAMIRSALTHAGALRIDHVMQLGRLYWVPAGAHARDGAYIHYPAESMFAILRLEADRVGAWIAGEDMGTVTEEIRAMMARDGMLGYRAALRVPVDRFPEAVMGASSTHDQATVAGTLTGSDMDDLRRIGKSSNFEQLENVRRELAGAAGVDLDGRLGAAEIAKAVLAQYSRLAGCRARVVLASLDDAAGVAERANMPGTVTEWPNWSLALPRPVEDILTEPLPVELARVLSSRPPADTTPISPLAAVAD
jgi:4-alpha-glucanotransferase